MWEDAVTDPGYPKSEFCVVSSIGYVVCGTCNDNNYDPEGSPSHFVAQALLILPLFSLLDMPSLWPEKLVPECMPFQKTWSKWTPKWSWQCSLASWGKEWRGCKSQWGGNTPTPDCSAWDAYRKHGDDSSHSKVFNVVTLYRIPKSLCLFSQVASPVFNKNASFFANKQNPISYKSFLLLNLLLLWKSRGKKKTYLPGILPSFAISQV